jgi:TonB family protein
MQHGILGYFRERARFERRVSFTTAAVALAMLGALALARTPPLQRALRDTLRFGYEGPTQYVRRITLEQYRGAAPVRRDLGRVEPVVTRRGGASAGQRSLPALARPETRPRIHGPGFSDADLMSRAVSRFADMPVIRSEELVIDYLVRPLYPQQLLDRNIEGKVTLQALIDTVGRVVDVEVLTSTGEPQFEEAAELAVRQCRFRPYRRAGAIHEVYAVFRFAFRIYDTP